MAKFCTNCGSEIKPGTKFCENCGQKLEQEQKPQEGAGGIAAAAGAAGAAGAASGADASYKKSICDSHDNFESGAKADAALPIISKSLRMNVLAAMMITVLPLIIHRREQARSF